MSNFIQLIHYSTLKLMLILAINPTQSLLMEGVESLLSANGKDMFEVISTTTTNITELVQEVDQLKPNIIIMEERPSLVNPADLFTALTDTGNIRLVVVNLNNNNLDIYHKSECTVSNPDHFIETLSLNKQMVGIGGDM